MKTEPNEFAFPMDFANDGCKMNNGLTKREYFACMAMQGFVSVTGNHYNTPFQYVAEWAVGMADALINELNKEK